MVVGGDMTQDAVGSPGARKAGCSLCRFKGCRTCREYTRRELQEWVQMQDTRLGEGEKVVPDTGEEAGLPLGGVTGVKRGRDEKDPSGANGVHDLGLNGMLTGSVDANGKLLNGTAGGLPPKEDSRDREQSKKTRSQLRKLGVSMDGEDGSEQVDLCGLIEMAKSCKALGQIEDALDKTWPPAKGNNLGVQGLKAVYRAMDLGLYVNRKMAMPGMAMLLWLLAGLAGDDAAYESACAIKNAKLPEELHRFIAERGHMKIGGRAVMDKWFRPVLQPDKPAPLQRPARQVPDEIRQELVSRYSEEFVQLASIGRVVLGVKQGERVTWSKLFKTEFLANQPVRFFHKKTKVEKDVVFNHNGSGILCQCSSCEENPSAWAMNHKGFLRHVGSKSTEILDCTTLVNYGFTLRQLTDLIVSPKLVQAAPDIYPSHCHECRTGGELLCCDGCTSAWHLACTGLDCMPEEDVAWLCPLCLKDGRVLKSETVANKRNMQRIVREKISRKGKRGRKPGSGYKKKDFTSGGGAGKAGRMRLMAPERAGRLQRNLTRNKRLFVGEKGGLQNGMRVYYRARSVNVLGGTIVINPSGSSGILCDCCSSVVSCSQFESHSGHAQRRQPYEHIWVEEEGLNLKKMAARLPELPEGGHGDDVHHGAQDVYAELDSYPTGCTFCREPDFQKEFGPRTIMICEQCMREFHVGCLENNGLGRLESLPEGDWFCDSHCGRIHSHFKGLVRSGRMPVDVLTTVDPATSIDGKRRQKVPNPYKLDLANYSFHVLNGSDDTVETDEVILEATSLLQESFDPIMDLASNTDLLPLMISASQAGEWDYSGMYTLLLKYCETPVVAAVVRVFGPQMAELPLIATAKAQRRRGHAKVLVDLFQKHLSMAGVQKLALPAAHETVAAWKHGFGFHDMPVEQVKLAKQQLHLLVFPGTEMLWKDIQGARPALADDSHHVLRPIISEQDKIELVSLMRSMVTQVVDELETENVKNEGDEGNTVGKEETAKAGMELEEEKPGPNSRNQVA